jgi:hypothetical protein
LIYDERVRRMAGKFSKIKENISSFSHINVSVGEIMKRSTDAFENLYVNIHVWEVDNVPQLKC